jgi:hypothetical protein
VLGGSIRTQGEPQKGARSTFGAGWIRIFNNPKRYHSIRLLRTSSHGYAGHGTKVVVRDFAKGLKEASGEAGEGIKDAAGK